jgi:hypothetical protein
LSDQWFFSQQTFVNIDLGVILMGIRNKGIFFALENDVVEEVAVDEGGMLEVTETVQDVTEQADVVEEHTDTLEDAVDGVEQIEAVKDVLESSVEEGEGVSEDAAEIAMVSVEAICNRLNMPKPTFVSVESFGSKNTRLNATKIAIESMSDKIDQAWQAIKAFFKKIWEHIKAFFKKIWTALTSFKDKTKDLLVRVKNATFKKGEYVIPGNMTVQEYTAQVKEATDNTALVVDAMEQYKKTLADLSKAAKDGNSEEVESIIKKANTSLGIAMESSGDKIKAVKKSTEEGFKAASDKEVQNKQLSDAEASAMANDVAKALDDASKKVSDQNKIDAELANVEKLNDQVIDVAVKEVKEAAKQADSGANAEEAKVKISLWTKVKSFASKAMSYLTSFVTGIFKRVVALIRFGFKWVWTMVSTAAGLVKTTASGVYKAAVKGEA